MEVLIALYFIRHIILVYKYTAEYVIYVKLNTVIIMKIRTNKSYRLKPLSIILISKCLNYIYDQL